MIDELDKAVLSQLATRWPDVAAARALWQSAGGRPSDVQTITDPTALWFEQWSRAASGDRVNRLSLVETAMETLPRNQALLDWLAKAAGNDRQIGEDIAKQVSGIGEVSEEVLQGILARLQGLSAPQVVAVMAPALRSVPLPAAQGLNAMLKRLWPLGKAGVESAIKATAEALVKALFASHGVT
jgi:hypothetical protein